MTADGRTHGVARRPTGGGFFKKVHALALHREIGLDVGMGGDGLRMAEPEGDDLQRDAGLEKMHRGGVSPRVGRDLFASQRGLG